MDNKKVKQNKETKREFDKKNGSLINIFKMFAYDKEPLTLEFLEEELNIKNRNVRDKISELSMHYAIISLCQQKGYEMLINVDSYSDKEILQNIDKINHQISDFQSRIKVLRKRMKPLIAWKKVAEKYLKEKNGE